MDLQVINGIQGKQSSHRLLVDGSAHGGLGRVCYQLGVSIASSRLTGCSHGAGGGDLSLGSSSHKEGRGDNASDHCGRLELARTDVARVVR